MNTTKPFVSIDFTIKNDQMCSGTSTINVGKGRVIGDAYPDSV